MKRPELLSPAGDMERLRFALTYGADAVYLAGKRFGMRAAPDNFTLDELEQAAALCKKAGARMYVTVNTLPRDRELDALPEYLQHLNHIRADGLIVADLGVLSLARRHAPHCEIHMSTQTSIVNAEAAKMYHELGASRAVLARELSLEEIREMRARIPRELELEVFVHGSMCMAYSGRCMLSAYLAGRDANRGACAQPCRWQYRVVEEYRPGEYLPVEEDAQGTYIFNSKDMNLLPRLKEIIDADPDKYGKLEWVATVYGDDEAQKSYAETESLMTNYPELKVICCPTTVGILACAQAVQAAKSDIKVAGLGLPSEMNGFVGEDLPCPYMYLWNPIDVGSCAVYVIESIIKGDTTCAVGETFTAGNGIEYTVSEETTCGAQIIVGPPFAFNAENIADWATVY